MRIKLFICLLFSLVFIGCKKKSEDAPTEELFMKAVVNGKEWKVSGLGKATFGPNYMHGKNRFAINIGGNGQYTDTVCFFIHISFDFVPKLGRYYFNNTGGNQADSGTIAVYSRYKVVVPVTQWSTGGYIDIDYFTKDYIKGRFSFTTKGDVNDTATTTIRDGAFTAINAGGNDVPWPRPQ